jgi:hypothetical protein
MKKIIIVILIISMAFIFTSQILAFENMTGEDWNELQEAEKERYLEGIIFGMNFFMINMYSEFNENIDPDIMAMQLEREGELIQPNQEDYDNIVNKVDNYFKENPEKDIFNMWLTDVIE